MLFAVKYFHIDRLTVRFDLSTTDDFSSFSVEYKSTSLFSSRSFICLLYNSLPFPSTTFEVVCVSFINLEMLWLFLIWSLSSEG